jgi:type VI secretion system protein VasG
MAVSNLKSLIGKLNETCRSALESAAGLCLSQTHYEVDIEHFLIKLLEMSDTDILKILKHFEVNDAHLVADLTRAIEAFKTGNARTPALSSTDSAYDQGELAVGIGGIPDHAYPLRPDAVGPSGQ